MISLFKDKRGFGFGILIMLVTLMVIVLICQNYLLTTTNTVLMTAKVADAMRAYYVADAGITQAFLALRACGAPPASLSVPPNNAYPVGAKSGSYAVIVTVTAGPIYTISSTGTYEGTTKTLTLTVRPANISRWGYNTDFEYVNPAISGTELNPLPKWFITGQTVGGPANTNDPTPAVTNWKNQFNISGNPIFLKPVTQVADSIKYASGGPPTDNPDFQSGFTPSSAAMTPASGLLTTISGAVGTTKDTGKFIGDTTIVLQSNGHALITNSTAPAWSNHDFDLSTHNAIYVQDGEVKVSGILKGRLTIGCSGNGTDSPAGKKGDIRINGSVIYNTDPLVTPSSTDMLGLVAQKNVKIYNGSYPSDVTVDAYLVAVEGSLYAMDWQTPYGTAPVPHFISFGGETSHYARVGGTFTIATGILYSGYLSMVTYDSRLANITPPCFSTYVYDAIGRACYEITDSGFNEPYS